MQFEPKYELNNSNQGGIDPACICGNNCTVSCTKVCNGLCTSSCGMACHSGGVCNNFSG